MEDGLMKCPAENKFIRLLSGDLVPEEDREGNSDVEANNPEEGFPGPLRWTPLRRSLETRHVGHPG